MTKLKLWREEYEVRLLKQKHGKYNYNPIALRSIIFGLRTEGDFKKLIIETVKNNQPHIKIYDSKLMDDGFGLTLTEVYF